MIEKNIQPVHTVIADIAFLILFAAEFTYYLLILQTGVVEYHHSAISEIWMVPVGGILGILLSVLLFQKREDIMSWLLLIQLLLSFDYADANGFVLFLLGVISGLTAPMLLYRIDKLGIVAIALAISYFVGTVLFHISASERMLIAVGLSIASLSGSILAQTGRKKAVYCRAVSVYTVITVFLWLLLDASLFETLSRDTSMYLWGNNKYTLNIVVFHTLGLIAAYRLRKWRYTDIVMVVLFLFAYMAYSVQDRELLSIVYPFVISYYNIAILYRIMPMGYIALSLVSIGLWGASGMGLLIALFHGFWAAWVVLGLLVVVVFAKTFHSGLMYAATHFISLKG